MESCVSSEKHDHDQVPASNLALFPISSTPFDFIRSFPFFRHPHPHPHPLTLSSKPSSSFPFLTMARGASDVATQLQKSIVSNVDRLLKIVEGLRSQNAALALDKVMSLYSYLQTCFHFQIPRSGGGSERQNIILSNNNFAAILPGGDSVAGVVVANGILNFLNIYNTLLIVRIVLTWFPNAPMAIVSPLSTICDPYLNVFRGIIPPLGGTLDLSPILAFLVLNAFTSTAAALPAELPPSHSQESNNMPPPHSPVTSSQKKWIRRLLAQSRDKPKIPPTGI